jgi:4-carboxymuconolactone decarboxylase
MRGTAVTTEGFEQGLQTRREVLGDEYVDRALAARESSPFGANWQEFLTEYCWDRSWGNDDLPRAVRSLITISLLAALGKSKELATHIHGARRNGCTAEQVRAALMHTAVYAGVPVGVDAFRVADEVWSAQ